MTPPRLLILGYGRLGRAFVQRHHAAYQVRGVKRTPIPGDSCELALMPIQSDTLRPHLAWADVVLFCPSSGGGGDGARGQGKSGRGGGDDLSRYRETYLGNMQFVVALLERERAASRMILVGSTGVYPRGRDGVWSEEQSIPLESDRQEVLWRTEQALAGSGVPYVILRCGGLYGVGRENFGWVRRKSSLPASELTDEPLALVHQDDVCDVIDRAIRLGATNEVFNVRDDSTLSRKELFGAIAARANIPIVQDGPVPPRIDRRIPNEKVKTGLGYRFSKTSILDYLEA